jgi:membrane protease YdiL (CAAX protease family)
VKLLRDIWRGYVSDVQATVDAESADYRRDTPASRVTRDMFIIVITGSLVLTFLKFAGVAEDVAWAGKLLNSLGLRDFSKDLMYAMTKGQHARINQRIWWAGARVIGYGLFPLLVVKLALRGRIADFGFKGTGRSQARIYFLLFAIVAPFVFAVSFGKAFQAKYPYYRMQPGESPWPRLAQWELLYASQFLALEVFFRGFLIQGLRKGMGYAAVLLPIIPYTTIHFGKPLPETLGSIVTGLVLGTMALKTRSIWGGAAIHVTVAVSMDLLSLWHQGFL